MEVFAKGLDNGIYTDETVKIGLEVVNGEDEDAEVGVDVKILGWPTEQGKTRITTITDINFTHGSRRTGSHLVSRRRL
jgi:hypothetical protein